MAGRETSYDEGDDESALVLAAARGDRRAAGEYFARNLPRLSSIARKVAGTSHDPGDLLGDALLVVLSKWADGTGPTEHVSAYIAQAMRNRMKDDFKSPRSKVRAFADDDDAVAGEDPRLRRVELDAELALIRRAMAELPDDQRMILTATVIDGIKPRELQERMDRPMTAIYSLSHRARANLRRATLRLILEDGARPDCRSAAQHLPENVPDSPDDVRGSRFTDHYRTCRRCRSAWARFGALATLGLAPLLIVGDLVFGAPTPAQASTDGPRDTPPQTSSPATSPGPRSATPAPGSADATGAPARAASVVTRLAVTAAVVVSGAGAAILTVLAIAFATQTLWFTPDPTASLDVRAQMTSTTMIALDVDFGVEGEGWTIETAHVTLSAPVATVRAPTGWQCVGRGTRVTCTTDQPDATGGEIALLLAEPSAEARYEVVVTAQTETGKTVEANYGDTVRR